jgi:hypothetical protein
MNKLEKSSKGIDVEDLLKDSFRDTFSKGVMEHI